MKEYSVVLMYHCVYVNDIMESGFLNESAFLYKLSSSEFEKQVEAVVNYLHLNKLPLNNVVFTFDDGGRSFLHIIAPILEKYGLRGIFFISTKYINTPGFLTRTEIKELADRGHVIGSHTHTHPSNITKLSDEEIEDEWKKSCSILHDILGCEMKIASIPNGYEGKKVRMKAQTAGIDVLYTSSPTTFVFEKYGLKVVGRYVVHNKMNLDEVMTIVSNKRRRSILFLNWWLLLFIKIILGNKYHTLKRMILNSK